MAERWNQSGPNYTVKLAELALRALRLSLTYKLDNLLGMINIHAPALERTTDGQSLLKQLRQELQRTRQALRGETLNGK